MWPATMIPALFVEFSYTLGSALGEGSMMGFRDKGELCWEVDWACFKSGFVRISSVFVCVQEILGLDGLYIII